MTNCWLGFATFRFALFIAVMFAVRAPEAAGDLIELKQHTAPVHTIQWSADGKRLATACEDGVVCVWDAAGKLVSKTRIEAVEHPIVSFTPDLTRIAVVRSKDSLSRRPVERNGGKQWFTLSRTARRFAGSMQERNPSGTIRSGLQSSRSS